MKKSIVSMLLTLMMVFSLFAPTAVFAKEAEIIQGETESKAETPLVEIPVEEPEEAAEAPVEEPEEAAEAPVEEPEEAAETPVEEPEKVVEEPEKVVEEPEEVVEAPVEEPVALQASTESFVVTLYADAGVLPADSTLKVAALKDASKADWVASGVQNKLNAQAVLDIKVISGGEEVQPDTEKGTVKLSFRYKENAGANMDIYHISDGATEKLTEKATEAGANVTVETHGFSYYVVEFHNDNAEYILEGDSETKLADILNAINIPGTAEQAKSSNDKLFSVVEKDGELYISANQPFNTEETLTVFMTDGIEYIIRVTDASYSHYATVSNKKHTVCRSDGSLGSYAPTEINLYTINGGEAYCVEVGVEVGGSYVESNTLKEACANGELHTAGGGGGYVSQSSAKAEKWYAYCHYFTNWRTTNDGKANIAMGVWYSLGESVPASSGFSGYDDFMTVWNAFEAWLETSASNYYGSNTRLYKADSNKQVLCVFTPYDNTPQNGNLAIVKVSANTAITNNNSCYSLAGAVYTVRNSSGTSVGTITTDSSGKGSLNNLSAGNYTIEETTAPKGFAKNSGATSFTITAGKTTTLNGTGVLKDKPQNDPVTVLVKKLNKATGAAERLGDGSLAGAQFTVKYYDGYYTASNLPGTADRTWVLKTDANGRSMLTASYLVSGDSFYIDAGTGDPCVPLGTLTIQETKAPSGFKLDNTLHVIPITANDDNQYVTAFNEITVSEEEFFGKIELTKMLVEGDSQTPEEGAEFQVYLTSAGSYAEAGAAEKDYLITDADGKAVSKSLPYGSYTVHQVKGKDGYQIAATDKTVSILTDDSIVSVAFENKKMEIGTKASGAEGEKVMNVATDITIVDTVSYQNLNVGNQSGLYRLAINRRYAGGLSGSIL